MTTFQHQDAEFERALRLRDEREYAAALDILRALKTTVDRRKLLAMVYMQLGNIYWKVGDRDGATREFSAAVSIEPRSELASLGLFNSLFDEGNVLSALTEMVRYLRLRDCADYRALMKDGFREPELRSELKELADEARRLIAKFDAN